jgi:hypothetical protein
MRLLLARLGLDLLLWCSAPAAFLLAYVHGHGAPLEAVPPHLRLVLSLLLGLALVRVVLAAAIPNPRAVRLAAAVAVSGLLGVMLAYYLLVLTGLQAWGRVVSWELIEGYSGQALMLAEALAVPTPLALGAPVLAYLLLLGGAWAYLGRFDWTAYVLRHAPRRLLALLLILGSAAGGYQVLSFTAWPAAGAAEPVSLTFFPMEGAWNFQGHAVDRLSAARQDEKEDAVRASFTPAPAAGRRNLILIVVDSLRADHMGIYGYNRDTTPNLARLERAGALRKAGTLRATCSSSACGLLSISSSKYVHQFSNRAVLLQEVLRRHGYRVHMILSGDHTGFYGLKQAYGELDSYHDGRMADPGRYMNDDRLVLERLAAFAPWDGTPVMLQLHLMSAHVLGRQGKAPPEPVLAQFRGAGAGHPPGRRERMVDTYDYSVLRTDALIGELLAVLERKGYLDDALVAVTADHGEALGEHGLYNHTNSVREVVLRVPFLLISYGERSGGRIDGQAVASQVDIAPTLLAELGLPAPSTWVGEPLQQAMRRHFTFFQQHAEVGLFDHREPAAVWKYWVNARTGEENAFNLSLDPAETTNAIGQVPPGRLREWRLRVMDGSSMFSRPGTH